MSNSFSTFITPINKDGQPDNRFQDSIARILQEVGKETVEELKQFCQETASLQRRAAKAGLRLAKAVFNEAAYLDKHHRFKADNNYGWRSKTLRKQAQQILEQIGFKRNNAHKLVTAASWLSSRYFLKDEQQWLDTLSPSHIYELSRMNDEGMTRIKQMVTFPEYTFSAGQQSLSVREFEAIRQQYPAKGGGGIEEPRSFQPQESMQETELQPLCSEKTLGDSRMEIVGQVERLEAASDTGELGNSELILQFTVLAKAIDWSAVGSDNTARQLLTAIEETLSFIADLAHESRYSPVI